MKQVFLGQRLQSLLTPLGKKAGKDLGMGGGQWTSLFLFFLNVCDFTPGSDVTSGCDGGQNF